MYKIKKHLDIRKNLSAGEIAVLSKLFLVAKMHKKELYIVGGAVRNALLGKAPKDIDLCTDATPEEIIDLEKEYDGFNECEIIETGLKHGTVTIYSKKYDCSFEITTFRVDGDYEDHRRPDGVTFTRSLEEDLKRRDLTINSFAYNFLTDELLMLDESYLSDLELGIIRTVGNPEDRFNEDALRMLRAIRFAAQFGFSIDKDTLNAICKHSSDLELISKERIRDELTKILLSDHPEMLDLIWVTGLDHNSIRFLIYMRRCEHNNPYHYTDVLHHTYDVIKGLPKDFCLRWTALFHDSGKPAVKVEGADGNYHFPKHNVKSLEIAQKYMRILKFDNKSFDEISKLVEHHDYYAKDKSVVEFKKFVNIFGKDLFKKYLLFAQADANAHQNFVNDIKLLDNVAETKNRFKEIILSNCPLTLKDLDINGDDLITLGYKGKEIGETLDKCLDYVLEFPDKNTKEDLFKFIKFEDKNERNN